MSSLVERVAADPPATGLLVTMVIEGMPARAADIKPGDVLVSYGGDGIAERADLQAAVEARAEEDAVEVALVRSGRQRTVRVAAGRLGVQTVPVSDGQPIEARPHKSPVRFDLDRLPDGEEWMSFRLDGGHVGFECHRHQRRGNTLVLDYEVAFDGGAEWGLNHFVVNVVLAFMRGRPEARSVRFENPLSGWITNGRLEKEGRTRRWVSSIKGPSGSEQNEVRVTADLLPSYAVSTLPMIIVPREGACLHYTPLNEGLGVPAPPAGLLCAGKDTVQGAPAWRFESHSFGERAGVTFVDDAGRIVRLGFGGPVAEPCARADALAGVNEALRPRLA